MGAGDLARAAFAFTGELPPGGDDPCMPHPACGNRTLGAHVCSCNWQKARKGCNDEETESGVLGGNLWPSLATRIEMGAVRPGAPQRAGVLLSVDDLGHSARFFRKTLPEYWRKDGLTWADMALNASDDFEALAAACFISTCDIPGVDPAPMLGTRRPCAEIGGRERGCACRNAAVCCGGG